MEISISHLPINVICRSVHSPAVWSTGQSVGVSCVHRTTARFTGSAAVQFAWWARCWPGPPSPCRSSPPPSRSSPSHTACETVSLVIVREECRRAGRARAGLDLPPSHRFGRLLLRVAASARYRHIRDHPPPPTQLMLQVYVRKTVI